MPDSFTGCSCTIWPERKRRLEMTTSLRHCHLSSPLSLANSLAKGNQEGSKVSPLKVMNECPCCRVVEYRASEVESRGPCPSCSYRVESCSGAAGLSLFFPMVSHSGAVALDQCRYPGPEER